MPYFLKFLYSIGIRRAGQRKPPDSSSIDLQTKYLERVSRDTSKNQGAYAAPLAK
jgi:hypothetical protein